jgi:hypothetical protein
MVVWFEEIKTGIQCGIDKDGFLFCGNAQDKFVLPDTKANREVVVLAFSKYTGTPLLNASAEPIQYNGMSIDMIRREAP